MTSDTTSLTIGPLRVIITARDPAVHTALRSAYRAFAVGDLPVPYSLSVPVEYMPGPAPAAWPFTFERSILRFTAAHYTGSLDLIAQRAHLSVVAPHRFEPIDYFVRAALALLAFEAGGLLFHAAGLAWREMAMPSSAIPAAADHRRARLIPLRRSSATISSSCCRMQCAGTSTPHRFQPDAGDARRSAVRRSPRSTGLCKIGACLWNRLLRRRPWRK
jgi:hypothetical protein